MDNNTNFNSEPNNEVYHATANLNTAIENPQMNIKNVVDVNIQNTNNTNIVNNPNNYYSNTASFNQNVQTNTNNAFQNNTNITENINSFQNNTSSSQIYQGTPTINNNPPQQQTNTSFIPKDIKPQDPTQVNYSISQQPEYKPTLENAKKKTKLVIPKELKIMIFIVIVLILFIFFMPYVYDFFKGLRLVVNG